MNVFTRFVAVSKIGHLSLAQCLLNKAMDYILIVGTAAIKRTIPQDRVIQCAVAMIILNISLAGLFRSAIKRACLAVYIDRAGKNISLYFGLCARFQDDDIA